MKELNIEDHLNYDYHKSKEQLMKETGFSERYLRHQLRLLKHNKVVVYNSQTRGYRLAKPLDIKTEDLKNEVGMVQHSLNDIEARRKALAKEERTYIAWIYDANKELERRGELI